MHEILDLIPTSQFKKRRKKKEKEKERKEREEKRKEGRKEGKTLNTVTLQNKFKGMNLGTCQHAEHSKFSVAVLGCINRGSGSL
jgi:hypothetical protein